MSFTNMDNLIAGMAQRGERFWFSRETDEAISNSHAQGTLCSLWATSGFPSPGVAPTTAAVCTKATTGALANFTNPSGGEHCRLVDIDGVCSNGPGCAFLFDRLIHCGGLSGTNVGVQTINTPAITRGDTTGVGVWVFFENYTGGGGTSRILSINYTNSANASGRTGTLTIPTNLIENGLIRMLGQAGDVGVKSVESVQLSGSTGTVGNFGITMAWRICSLPTGAPGLSNTPYSRAGGALRYPRIEADACLWLVGGAPDSISGVLQGGFSLFKTG